MAVIAAVLALAVTAACAPSSRDPNIQLAGIDDSVPNCAALTTLLSHLYIGGPTLPSRPVDESFAQPPVDTWCNSNIGYSSETYGPDGVTFSLPRTDDGPFHNNAELIALPEFEPGQTMTYDVRGFDVSRLNGSFGFGATNRTLDYGNLEIAWFMRNDTTDPIGAATTQLAPLFRLFGIDFPRGFFLMVKRAGELLPRIRLIDERLLASDHSYSVRLDPDRVVFAVDGDAVASFADPPTGTQRDFAGYRVPLVGQIWIDGGYWLPLPIPQYNTNAVSVTLARYRQGPSSPSVGT